MDTDDPDLGELLARSFGDGPTHRPLDERLAAGRRSLRRRRIGTGLVAAAVVGVLGTSYAVATGGPRAAEPPPAVTTGTPSPSPAPKPDATDRPAPAQPGWDEDFVRYSADLRLQVRPGATVVTRIRNPARVAPPAVSDALTVHWKGTDYWVVMDADPTSSGVASFPAAPGSGRDGLRAWVDAQIAADRSVQDPTSGDPAADFPGTTVRFDDSGALVADPGHRIVQQRRGVDLGETFAPAGATTALALVEDGGGRTWWLGRVVDGQADYIPYPAEAGQDLEEFLVFARDAYASGEGLR